MIIVKKLWFLVIAAALMVSLTPITQAATADITLLTGSDVSVVEVWVMEANHTVWKSYEVVSLVEIASGAVTRPLVDGYYEYVLKIDGIWVDAEFDVSGGVITYFATGVHGNISPPPPLPYAAATQIDDTTMAAGTADITLLTDSDVSVVEVWVMEANHTVWKSYEVVSLVEIASGAVTRPLVDGYYEYVLKIDGIWVDAEFDVSGGVITYFATGVHGNISPPPPLPYAAQVDDTTMSARTTDITLLTDSDVSVVEVWVMEANHTVWKSWEVVSSEEIASGAVTRPLVDGYYEYVLKIDGIWVDAEFDVSGGVVTYFATGVHGNTSPPPPLPYDAVVRVDDTTMASGRDDDSDGYPSSIDCDDSDPRVNVQGNANIAALSSDFQAQAIAFNPRNHGAFVSTVAHLANELLENGCINDDEHSQIVSSAATTNVGKRVR